MTFATIAQTFSTNTIKIEDTNSWLSYLRYELPAHHVSSRNRWLLSLCAYGLNLWCIKRIYATAESLQLHTHRWHYKKPGCTLSQWSTVAQVALVFLFRRNVVLHVFTNESRTNLEPLLVLFLLTRWIRSQTDRTFTPNFTAPCLSFWKKYDGK